MGITNKKVILSVYIAECPICGHAYIWLASDLRKGAKKCRCGYVALPRDYEYELLEEVELLFTEEGVKVNE